MANAPNTPKPPNPSVVCDYEAKCPQTWAWYPANITDFDPKSGKFQIKYPNDWKESSWESASDIRYAAKPVSKDWRPVENETCECKAKAEENEPFGWWGCQMKSLSERANGIYAFIQFDGWPEEHNEMLELEYLRPRNKKKCLSETISSPQKTIIKKVIDVPEHAKDWVSDRSNLKIVKKRLIAVDYRRDESQLILIGTDKLVTLASGLVDLHFDKQRTLYLKRKNVEKAETKVRQIREREANASKTTFKVHPLLSGYLYGRDRLNTSNVRELIKDVVNIKLDHGVCEILAETEEALSEAVDMLQIVAKKVIIPKREMAPIIGKKGEDIRKLKSDVEVIRIISWSRFPEEYLRLKARHDDRYGGGTHNTTRPGTGESNDNEDESSKSKKNKGKKGRNNNTNNSDEQTDGYNPRDNNNNEYFNNNEDIRSILHRYGVKISNNKQGNNKRDRDNFSSNYHYRDNNSNVETREYPNELIEEIHNFFSNEKEDIIELLSEDEKKNNEEEDALVIIGKKSNVNLCVSMIMLQLNHIRKINNQKQRIKDLYAKLRDIKGYAPQSPRNYYNRGDRRQGGGGGGGGYDRDRDQQHRDQYRQQDQRGDGGDRDTQRRDQRDQRGDQRDTRERDQRDTRDQRDPRDQDRDRGEGGGQGGQGNKSGRGKKNRRGGKNRQSQDYESKEESMTYSTPQRQVQQRSNISVRRRKQPKYQKVKSKDNNKNANDSEASPTKGGGDGGGGESDNNDNEDGNNDNNNSNKKSKKNRNKEKSKSVTAGSGGRADDGAEVEADGGGEDETITEVVKKEKYVEDDDIDGGGGSKKRRKRRRKKGKSGAVDGEGELN